MNDYTFKLRVQVDSTNKLNPYGFVDATSIDIATGLPVNDASTQLSDFLPILPSTSYVLLSVLGAPWTAYAIGCYDINQNYIQGFANQGSFTTPATCYYLRITLDYSATPSNFGVFKNVSVVSFLPYYNYQERDAHPNFNDSMALEWERESGQQFFRTNLSDKLTFLADDYDFIMAQPIDDTLFVDMYEGDTMIYSGMFHRTDCTIDADDKALTVQPKPNDGYEAVLDGYEKEYDIIPLNPVIEAVTIDKRPLIQVYVPGDDVVTCHLRGMTWEQDCEAVDDMNTLAQTYSFSLDTVLKEINITGDGLPAARSLYAGKMTPGSTPRSFEGALYPQQSNGYYLWVQQVRDQQGWRNWFAVCELRQISDNTALYKYTQQSSSGDDFDNKDFTLSAVGGATGTMEAEMASYNMFVRYLCDVTSIRGQQTTPIPAEDIVENNRNYHYIIGLSLGMGEISNRYSTAPTEYGRADGGYYFAPPASNNGRPFFPVAKSTWRRASLWISPRQYIDAALEKEARKTYVLRDAFPVWSVIQVLLKQVAPELTHKNDETYSQFLYGETNPVSGDTFSLLVAPKSNILTGEYTQPAQKAVTTLREVMNMLATTFQCYWYVDNGKLKIEHISFFKNGGSYTGTPLVGQDLTAEIYTRNGKAWAFSTSQYSYEKEDMPERYQFAWMDDVTQAFTGLPIEVLSKYVKQNRTEDVNVTNYTSDVDYMLLNPSDCSKDGFALLSCVPVNLLLRDDSALYPLGGCVGQANFMTPDYPLNSAAGGERVYLSLYGEGNGLAEICFRLSDQSVVFTGNYIYTNSTPVETSLTVPENATSLLFLAGATPIKIWVYKMWSDRLNALSYVDRLVQGVEYTMQNGLLAFTDLQPKYWRYNMPAPKIKINDIETTALTTSRRKVQEVKFPAALPVDEKKLIKTFIGNGEINKLSVTLSRKTAKATLRHDTE